MGYFGFCKIYLNYVFWMVYKIKMKIFLINGIGWVLCV